MKSDWARALSGATHTLLSLQRDDGCWEGEMVWCTMILSQYVIVRHITGRPVDERSRAGMVQHYRVTQLPDGSWGLHPESGGYVFTTTLAYVALRLLGTGADDPLVSRARDWLHRQPGGVLAIPTWGKFWLSMLGLYGYEGVNPFPPELFILPDALPLHPNRLYCHTRQIYAAVAYLYGRRFQADLGPLGEALRYEVYGDVAYESIDFARHRHHVAASDLYVRPRAVLRAALDGLASYERVHSAALRRRALAHCFERILFEQRSTQYLGLSPVNGLLNCLAIWCEDPHHPDLEPSLAGVDGWRWEDEAAGIRYVGARSHSWDTAFAVQALAAALPVDGPIDAPSGEATAAALRRAHVFLCQAQLTHEISDFRRWYRDPARGGWCFSDGAHRWPVSDCTAEALSAVLRIERALALPVVERLPEDRVCWAVEFILQRQNPDGGFGTYERRRGPVWLEQLNPSEMFGSCMTERSYVECTASAVGALAEVRDTYPALRDATIDAAITRGVSFLRRSQRPDGSWSGFWGINFTYAIFHVVRALSACGVPAQDQALQRAARWLVATQRADGGWGEHYASCLTNSYVEHPQSQPVMTSWALLVLADLIGADAEPVQRGLAWLLSQQRPDGSWPAGAVNGVFFGSAMLHYRLYEAYFPVWAVARCTSTSMGATQGCSGARLSPPAT